MKKKIMSIVTLVAMCTVLLTSCAERHAAPPAPPTPQGVPTPPPPPAPPK